MALRSAEKSCVFMHRWSADTYPFGCARESSQRKGCREVVYELFAAIYPDYMLEGVAHGDVAMAIAKTAAALYNDDPMHKRMVQGTLHSMTLAQGMPFEKGVCQGSVGKSGRSRVDERPGAGRPAGRGA
jgi:hypothetical protein